MLRVSARDLRADLHRYLDLLEEGEEIEILRHSRVIGTFTPANPRPKITPVVDMAATLDTPFGEVNFRQFRESDRQKVLDLYVKQLEVRVDHDLYMVRLTYLHDAGEFLVAVLGESADGESKESIVACGGFVWSDKPDRALLKRFRVREDCLAAGVGERLKCLLEIAAQGKAYKNLIDVSNTT